MKSFQVDDDTFARWQQRAAEQGLSVTEWLVQVTNRAAPTRPTAGDDQLDRLRAFEQTLVGQGGQPQFNRHDLYD